MLKFWEEIRHRKNQSYLMVSLKGIFKVETGRKWHMLSLVDVTDSGIKIRVWVVRWLYILVEYDVISEGWVFQYRERYMVII